MIVSSGLGYFLALWWGVIGLPIWFLSQKAKIPGWWNVIQIVPFIGQVVMLYVVTFREWPKEVAVDPRSFE